MRSVFYAGFLAVSLVFQGVVADDRPIDIPGLNKFFESISAEVLKAKQAKDPAGKDFLESLTLSIDPAASSVVKGSEAVVGKASVGVASAKWDSSKASSLDVLFSLKKSEPKPGELLVAAGVTAALKTDAAALVRYAVKEAKKAGDLCDDLKGKDAKEEVFLKEACKQIEALETAADTAVILDTIQSIVEKRVTYIDERLKELETENDTSRKTSLQIERKYEVVLRDGLKARTDKGAVDIVIDATEVPVGDDVQLSSLTLSVSAGSVGVKVEAKTSNPMVFDMGLDVAETWSSAVSLPEGDPKRVEATTRISGSLNSLVDFIKEIALPEANPPAAALLP